MMQGRQKTAQPLYSGASGRRVFPGCALHLALLLQLGQRPALAKEPPGEVGSKCAVADETSRLRCQLDEARTLLLRQRLAIEDKKVELQQKEALIKDNNVELERRAALIKEKDMELAQKDAAVKAMWAHLARTEAQGVEAPLAREAAQEKDTSLAQKDAPIKDKGEQFALRKALIEEPRYMGAESGSQRALAEESRGMTANAHKWRVQTEPWKEQRHHPGLWPRNHLSKQVIEKDHHVRHLFLTDDSHDLPTIIPKVPIDTESINLLGSEITGTLPASIGRLVHLKYLDLSSNHITGTIPPEIGMLKQLTYLGLGDNKLTGTIPSELGNLTNLTHVRLDRNDLSGTIPPELAKLRQLSVLYLFTNGLAGTIPPELCKLSRLTELYLQENQLTGSIPADVGKLTQLTVLTLGGNGLTGVIPTELCNLMQLTSLWLPSNQLSGTIPPELGNLTQLTQLRLWVNSLTGSIPKELGNLANLNILVMSVNQLSGTIPPELGNLTQLLVLDLAYCGLTGTIPAEFGKLTQVQQITLLSNGLTGPIPEELSNMSSLAVALLQDNKLNGSLPEWMGKEQFISLDLSGNLLTGTIPPTWGKMTNMLVLKLGGNRLTGTILPDLGKLASLLELDISSNGLSGTIPPELGSLALLSSLKLGGNRLTGTVPSELGSLAQLQNLILAGNLLSGTLPESIGQLEALVKLDVSDNRDLTGHFPDTTGNAQLATIFASGCSFTSAGAVGDVTKTIKFANNNLTELPAEWVNLTKVVDLDVSNNRISVWRLYGVLPSYAFQVATATCGIYPQEARLKWPAIQSVNLSGNPFGRNITTRDFIMSLSYLTTLSELYAANCHLQGVVPLDYYGNSFGVDVENTGEQGPAGCDPNDPDAFPAVIPAGFRALLTLDLSDNNISAIMLPPPERLSMADLHNNPLVQLNPAWYSTPSNLEVWNGPLLRANVTPPWRERGCPSAGAPTLEADPFGFVSKPGEDAFQCTTVCGGVKTRYKHDASLNVSSLCRCTVGRQGAATNCTGCPADTYSDVDAKDKWAMVRTCRPCPALSSTDSVQNATGVDQCKCQAGWYMEMLAEGSDTATPACARCKQGTFMETLPGATQEAQCFCNASYDGLRALLGSCGCADGLYMDHLARACRRCDSTAEECVWGSQIGLSLLPPVIRASYWAAPPPEVGPDEVTNFSKHDIWRCYSTDTCLGNGTCAVGRSGTACSLCDEGMYGGPDGPCKPCPYNSEDTRKNLLYGLLIGPGAMIAAHILLSSRADSRKQAFSLAKLGTSGKQSLKYLQMLGVMAGFNIDWPPLALNFFTEVSHITVNLPQVAGVACLADRQTASLEMGFRWLLPVAGLLSACLSALVLAPIRLFCRKSRFHEFLRMNYWDVLRVSLWGMTLFYSTLLQFGTQVLACAPGPNGRITVVTFPHLRCGDSGEWAQLAAISSAFLLLFVGAVFLGVYAAWHRATRALVESNFESSGWWGFLFDDYRDGWGHWLMLTMAKDAALVVIATVGASNGPSQLLATAALSTAYSYVVLRDQPFRGQTNNVVEAWTMMSVAVLSVFTAGMGFQSAPGVADVTVLYSDGASDPEYKKREQALFAVQCFTFVGPAGIMLYQLLCVPEKVRKWLPAFLRPPTEEERARWNRDFIGSLKLDEASAADLWGVMDRFDVVDSARFRDLMSTSTATLGIVPSGARGISIKGVARRRFSVVAKASKHNEVATQQLVKAAAPPSNGEEQAPAAEVLDAPAAVPAEGAEDDHIGHGTFGAAAVTRVDGNVLVCLDVVFEGEADQNKPNVESL